MNHHVEPEDLHFSQICHTVPQFLCQHTKIIQLSSACGHDLVFKDSETFAYGNAKYQKCRAI